MVHKYWSEAFADPETDLDAVARAYAREVAIREGMASTGESREIVAETLDSLNAMDEEAVLDLTEGHPTTMGDALSRYVDVLNLRDEIVPRDQIVGDLDAIITYPWPADEAVIATHVQDRSLRLNVLTDDEGISISLGTKNPVTIYTVLSEDSSDFRWVGAMATAVHRTVLARVIGDRDHHVQISSTDRRTLLAWLEHPNGSWTSVPEGDGQVRVSVDAVEGGGAIVRTRPYRFTPPLDGAR